MDHATLTDNQGREVDFRHVVLIMTSNVGTREMTAKAIGFGGGRVGDGSKEVEIELTDAARAWLAEKGYDPDFGARPLARVIQTELKDRLADDLLFGPLATGGRVTVDLDGDRLGFRVES
jgi:ATP-dependent Clp protease ATP-binding subunit ClpA